MLDQERFLEVFKSQFEEKARKFISMNSAFKQIEGWSSLQALIITVAIHDEWGISFTDEDIKSSTTVNDLFEVARKKLEE